MGLQNITSSLARRASRRYDSDMHAGKILNRDRDHLCDCGLHDVSPDGARVVLAQNVTLPSALSLYDSLTGQYFDAILAWRQGLVVGLQFVSNKS